MKKKLSILFLSLILTIFTIIPLQISAATYSIKSVSNDIVNSKKLKGRASGTWYLYNSNGAQRSYSVNTGSTSEFPIWRDFSGMGDAADWNIWIPNWGIYEDQPVGLHLKWSRAGGGNLWIGDGINVHASGTIMIHNGGQAGTINKNEVQFYKNVNASNNRPNGEIITFSSEKGQIFLACEQGDNKPDTETHSVDTTREVVAFEGGGDVYIDRGQASTVEEFSYGDITWLRTKRGNNASFNAVKGYNNTNKIVWYNTVWKTDWDSASNYDGSESWGFNLWQGGTPTYELIIDLNDSADAKATMSPNKLYYEGIAKDKVHVVDSNYPVRDKYKFNGWTIDGPGTFNEETGDYTFGAGNGKMTANWLHYGDAIIEFIDKTRDNELLETKNVEGPHDDSIVSVYTTKSHDIEYYTDRGYKLVRDGLTSDLKFKAGETTTVQIVLEHTYTTVDKKTYEKDKCLNNACTAKQLECLN